LQRMWLTATEREISLHPMCAMIYLFTRMVQGQPEDMEDEMRSQLEKIRPTHMANFNLSEDESQVFMFKIFKGDPPSKLSVRKELQDVLIFA
ncbi:MAG: hypothetical protein IH946_11480, partial [Bacteroidetes bacterium]|nr:hypothetical protein [Bacteroidota bacterium]